LQRYFDVVGELQRAAQGITADRNSKSKTICLVSRPPTRLKRLAAIAMGWVRLVRATRGTGQARREGMRDRR